jgi:hypothetical protein
MNLQPNDHDENAENNPWRAFLYHPSTRFYLAFAILVALLLLLITFFTHQNDAGVTFDAPQDAEGAWKACAAFIEIQQRIPSSEAPTYDSGNVTMLADGHYQVKMTYPASGVTFECLVITAAKDGWQLENLVVK